MRISISNIKSPTTQSLYSRLVILISAIFLAGCSNERLPIYNEGEVQLFNVSLGDKSVECNYLELHSMPGKFFLLQDNIIWKAEFSFADGSKEESESHTGLLNSISRVWLHPPRIGPLELLEAFPFPDVRFPLHVGNTWNNSIKVISGFRELNGKNIKSEYEVVNWLSEHQTFQDTLWEIRASSSFEGDPRKFNVTYLFSNNYGFVSYIYRIDSLFFAEMTLDTRSLR